ncbi:MAG: EAL domain-containing protein [Bacillota bacterium]
MEVKDAIIYLKFKIAVIDLRDSTLDLSDILKKSNIILKSLFNNKHKNYGFYDKVAEEKLKRHENIQNELRNIIENKNVNKKLYLNYQPFINTKNNEVVGFEALARFNSENYGRVSPAEFINIAEKQGLIIQLTKIILKEAFNFIIKLNENGYENLKVAVNISSIHLLSEDFEKEIERLSPNRKYILNNLDLEITESVFLDDFDLINNKLKKLQEKGIKISLDNFGTGYSSFSRFTELNIDYLKIDKCFIDKILDEKKGALIIKKIIFMAHSLGIKVIAEGVEEKKQEKHLKKYDCDILQGYFYSKPINEEKVFRYLEKN